MVRRSDERFCFYKTFFYCEAPFVGIFDRQNYPHMAILPNAIGWESYPCVGLEPLHAGRENAAESAR